MAFEVSAHHAGITVELTGLDRVLNWRRRIRFDAAQIRIVAVADRLSLESTIDHRTMGYGTHNGSKRPGRKRVGTMLGRGVSGKQFWAVNAGAAARQLVVLDLDGHDFARAVLEVDDPQAFKADLQADGSE